MLSKFTTFYRANLSRFLPFRMARAFLLFFYRFLYRAYSLAKFLSPAPSYTLVSFDKFCDQSLAFRTTIASARKPQLYPPNLLNHPSSRATFKSCLTHIKNPKIDLVHLKNSKIVGKTDFVFTQQYAIAPDPFIESCDTCPAAVFGPISLNHKDKKVRFYKRMSELKVACAINLVGQSTTNYAHWLTEILPKLALLRAQEDLRDIPIVLDKDLPQNMLESVDLIGGKERMRIFLSKWQEAKIENLYCLSQPGYEPYVPHGIDNRATSKIINSFSQPALQTLRECAWQAVGAEPCRSKRIFLVRSKGSTNLRGLENADQVISLLEGEGFQSVDPAKLSFAEQIQLCSQAEIIIAPVGAALANMIFASERCKILILSPYHEGANYYYYSNLAATLGHPCYYVVAPLKDLRTHPMHSQYNIEIKALMTSIQKLKLID